MDEFDPIPLLQQYATNKDSVQLVDAAGTAVQGLADAQTVVFGELKLPKTQKTILKKSGTEEYYTIETLLLMVDHRDENYLAYLKSGVGAEIPTVTVMDRNKLLGMLSTSQDTSSAKRQPLDVVSAAAGLHAEKRARTEADQAQIFSETDIANAKAVTDHEQIALSRDALICSNRSFDEIYKHVRDLLTQQSNKSKTTPSTSKDATSSKSKSSSGSSSHSRPKGARIPIIIVPAAATSMVNLYNVKQFLEDKSFIDSRNAREQSTARPTLINIERRSEGSDTTSVYQVIDSVDKLRPDDWKRVVAVFTTGAEWQFKNWVWQTPLDIFNNVKGYYLKYADEPTKDTVQRWNVTILEVHKYKRHTDQVVVGEFWDALDAFIASKRPYLL